MNTILKLTALGALLACAGVVAAANATPAAFRQYPTGPVSINPQPLPPLVPDGIDSSAGRTLPPGYPATLIGINPQPLPPLGSRSS